MGINFDTRNARDEGEMVIRDKVYNSEALTWYEAVDDLVFERCSFKNMILTKGYMNDVKFRNCHFQNVTFNQYNMQRISFEGCYFERMVFLDTVIENLEMVEWLGRITFIKCALYRPVFVSSEERCVDDDTIAFVETRMDEALCPPDILPVLPEGSLIGYKKLDANLIAKLFIPKSAKRSISTASKKCRASKAKVLAIYSAWDGYQFPEGYSLNDPEFKYKVGEYVTPRQAFDEHSYVECTSGIHFFLTEEEAIRFHL